MSFLKLKTKISFLLFFLLFLGHLDEWIFEQSHACYQTCEPFLFWKFFFIVGDALSDPIGTDADLILREGLLHPDYLLFGFFYDLCLGLSEDLFEGFLFRRAAVGSESVSDDVELRRNRERCAWLVFFDVAG